MSMFLCFYGPPMLFLFLLFIYPSISLRFLFPLWRNKWMERCLFFIFILLSHLISWSLFLSSVYLKEGRRNDRSNCRNMNPMKRLLLWHGVHWTYLSLDLFFSLFLFMERGKSMGHAMGWDERWAKSNSASEGCFFELRGRERVWRRRRRRRRMCIQSYWLLDARKAYFYTWGEFSGREGP